MLYSIVAAQCKIFCSAKIPTWKQWWVHKCMFSFMFKSNECFPHPSESNRDFQLAVMTCLAPISHSTRQSVVSMLIWEIGAWSCAKAERDTFPMHAWCRCPPSPPALPAKHSKHEYFPYEVLKNLMIQSLLIYPDPLAVSLTWKTGKKNRGNKLPSLSQRQPSPSGVETKHSKEGGGIVPGWGWQVYSSFHSRWGSLLFQLRFSTLTLALAQEKGKRGSLL